MLTSSILNSAHATGITTLQLPYLERDLFLVHTARTCIGNNLAVKRSARMMAALMAVLPCQRQDA
jgi:hypothetical protein